MRNQDSDARPRPFSGAPYGLVATRAPKGFGLGSLGRFWDLGIAMHNKAVLEANGFAISVQLKTESGWRDFSANQTKLEG